MRTEEVVVVVANDKLKDLGLEVDGAVGVLTEDDWPDRPDRVLRSDQRTADVDAHEGLKSYANCNSNPKITSTLPARTSHTTKAKQLIIIVKVMT